MLQGKTIINPVVKDEVTYIQQNLPMVKKQL